MKKRSFDTQPQLTRLHALVQRIQRGDYPSRKILAAEWEKTPRTIQADLDFIRDVWELPLEYDPRKYGYFFSKPVDKFPMVPISEQELVSVFVAQKALRAYHGTPFERPLKAAFEKLVGSLAGEVSVAWADLDSAISFRGIEANPADADVFQKLSGAVRSRNEVEFEYQKVWPGEGEVRRPESETSPQPGAQQRRVRPYHLGYVNNQWYLFGYDLDRGAIRKFVPGRMSGLRVLATRFARPKDFSVDKLLKGSFGVFSGGQLMEMRIWFDRSVARIVKERKWHPSQQIRELANGEIELKLELSSFVEIVPWILGWGARARAVAPPELVQAVAQMVRELVATYSPGPPRVKPSAGF